MLQVVYNEDIMAQNVMDIDKKMLDELSGDSMPILHFYEWKNPSITYGHFIAPEKYLNLDNLKKNNIDIARRPTGGGIVFHIWDMAFSFLLPSGHTKFSLNTLDNYFFVNSCVLSSVKNFIKSKEGSSNLFDLDLFDEDSSSSYCKKDYQAFFKQSDLNNFCMAMPTKFDVIVKGRKLAGAAQRRTKKGYLHQGTISLSMPDLGVLDQLLLDKNTIHYMNENTFPLFKDSSKITFDEKKYLKNILIEEFEKNLL